MMLKQIFSFFLCLVFSLAVIWGCMFGVDYYRCTRLQKPLFAIGLNTADDGGSGTYQGLGYTVEVDGELTAEYGYVVQEVELRLLDKLIFAAIT